MVGQPQGVPIPPPEFGPPPYEPPSQPGFVPPHMPTDGSGPYVPPGESCWGTQGWGLAAALSCCPGELGAHKRGLGLQQGSLGWAGGHSACSRAGPESVLQGWCCSRVGPSPIRIWPLLPCRKLLTCLCFSSTAGYYPPPGPHPPMGYYPAPGPYPSPGGHTATVLVPPGAATTVTVLQGEIFQGAPVQTVCPHCQQAITTKISYEIGLMSFLLGFFCCFVG